MFRRNWNWMLRPPGFSISNFHVVCSALCLNTDYRHTMAYFAAQIQIPIPNKNLGFGYKGLVFCRNNGWLMENMDKGLTVPKWVLINWPKIPEIPRSLSAQIVCPSPKKYLGFGYKGLVFCRINGKHGQGTHSSKMGADKSFENTPNAPKFIFPNGLPKPKIWFRWKKGFSGRP